MYLLLRETNTGQQTSGGYREPRSEEQSEGALRK